MDNFDFLTVKVVLYLYSGISYITCILIERVLKLKLKNLDLRNLKNKLLVNLNRGNKRKLLLYKEMLGIIFLRKFKFLIKTLFKINYYKLLENINIKIKEIII